MLHKLIEKINSNRLKKISVILVCLLLAGITASVLTHLFVKPVDCAKLTSTANTLLKQNKYKQAYSLIKSHQSECTSLADTLTTKNQSQITKVKIQTVQYSATIANLAFANGDLKQASQFADLTLKDNAAMTLEQRLQIPNQEFLMMQMISIQSQAALAQNQKSGTP